MVSLLVTHSLSGIRTETHPTDCHPILEYRDEFVTEDTIILLLGISCYKQRRSKDMANWAYARGAKLCKSRTFILQFIRHFSIIHFEVRICCLFIYTTCEFIYEIMKIERLNKKFHMKKLSMNLSVIKREKQIFKV
jgi:hypothetical protein